jgi:hypothetical protein
MNETTNPPTGCFVRHEDAGGPCGNESVMEVHGIPLCQLHGREARIGALSEACHAAASFLERQRFAGAPEPLNRALGVALGEIDASYPTADSYHQALVAAYPDPPVDVRERVKRWQAGAEPGDLTAVDILLKRLDTIHRLMRIAHEAGEGDLVELLEEERELTAAEAAVALADVERFEQNATR